MVPLKPTEPFNVNAFDTVARLTSSQIQTGLSTITTHDLFTVVQLQLTIT